MTNLPIACALSPAALRARRKGLLADLLRRAEDHHDVPDGGVLPSRQREHAGGDDHRGCGLRRGLARRHRREPCLADATRPVSSSVSGRRLAPRLMCTTRTTFVASSAVKKMRYKCGAIRDHGFVLVGVWHGKISAENVLAILRPTASCRSL